jgi:hypothetical protein
LSLKGSVEGELVDSSLSTDWLHLTVGDRWNMLTG